MRKVKLIGIHYKNVGKGNGMIYINYLSFTGNLLTNWKNTQDLDPHTFDYIRVNIKWNCGI